ncbi:hypothetical protein FOPG_13221 [Fusarium oxysporum f. sp. conglutinans race 2 54008]|uniref:Uncharacterized protein n=1 Tax=Fusarium oxysporum f. sp. conglutinans race 2 54008 TaxID=1089457 RepID=X0ICM3_FUSOX|nr:hypothetical protein FOPG_13221 [Fusarium oxysporum f. sp. conglutinans race 2 54008]
MTGMPPIVEVVAVVSIDRRLSGRSLMTLLYLLDAGERALREKRRLELSEC